MSIEVLRIKTEGKSNEFLQVLSDFKRHLGCNPKSCRAYVTCFMQGMFFYDKANYKYITVECFHKTAIDGRLDIDKYEYILINYKVEV